MMDIESVLLSLRQDFTFSHSESSDTLGAVITLYSNWAGKTPGVEFVGVWLTGIDPLTGRNVKEDKGRVSFSEGTKDGIIGPVKLHGKFELHFFAKLEDGQWIPDFRPPESIVLAYPMRRPMIKVEQKTVGEYRQLQIESNCWPLLKDNTWLFYNGHYQLLPISDSPGRVRTWYIPTKSGIELRFTDEVKKYGL